MRSDQNIIVGGTLNGERVTTPPLPANVAIIRYSEMVAKGFTLMTMTDADTGHDYNVSQTLSVASPEKQ